MHQTISGLVAAIAVVTASAVPAMACGGGGLFQSSCSPCGQAYVSSCEQTPVYVAPAPTYSFSNCDSGCGGWTQERLPDPVQQYYYVEQGPTYTGPGNFAPYRTYQEGRVSGWGGYRHHHSYRYGYHGGRYAEPRYDGGPRVRGSEFYGYRARPHFRHWREHMGYRYPVRPSLRYGYFPHRYAPHYGLPQRQFQAPHRSLRYGGPVATPRVLGTREHHPRRYN